MRDIFERITVDISAIVQNVEICKTWEPETISLSMFCNRQANLPVREAPMMKPCVIGPARTGQALKCNICHSLFYPGKFRNRNIAVNQKIENLIQGRVTGMNDWKSDAASKRLSIVEHRIATSRIRFIQASAHAFNPHMCTEFNSRESEHTESDP